MDLYHVALDATNPHDGSKATVTRLTSVANIEVHWLARNGHLPNLLAFDSPSRHPALFAADRRRDPIHLNEDGAREWSRQLAEGLAAWLDERS